MINRFLIDLTELIILYYIVSSGAPEWAEHINDTEKDVGSELTLRCVAVGKPQPWIRWLKDGYSVNTLFYLLWKTHMRTSSCSVCFMSGNPVCSATFFLISSTAKGS